LHGLPRGRTKLVGPAYKDVAAKYAGQKGAEDKLVAKVMKGGSGSWGPVPMPANPQVSEAEARSLVKWVLSPNKPSRSKKSAPARSRRAFFLVRVGWRFQRITSILLRLPPL
jgi:hypothetical protein